MNSFTKKNTREKDVVGIVTFDLIGLLPTNHTDCLYYNGIPEFVRKSSTLTVKYIKYGKIFEISFCKSGIYKKW